MSKQDVPSGIMKLDHSLISPLVLVVGDPARAKYVSTLLTDCITVAQAREYHTYTGLWKGVRVTVASHGVGSGGASMAFEELINAGAKTIIRAGTCGSLNPDYRQGSMFIAIASVRNDGVTGLLVPPAYPAYCDHEVTLSLINAIKKSDIKYKVGVMCTEGKFYDGPLGNDNLLWQKCGVIGIEMELSVLNVIGSLRGIRTGGIFSVDNYIFQRLGEDGGCYAPNQELVLKCNQSMCQISLDALIELNN